MKRGFTLIEMLVTIAVISVIAGAIIVGINPAQRIRDAQNSKGKQDTRSIAGSVEACLSYVNPSTYVVNVIANCDTGAELVSGGFARSVPSTLTINANATAICASSQGESATVNWKYYTATQGAQDGGVVFSSASVCAAGS